MACYRSGGCGPYEMRPCNECPASHPTYASYMGGPRPEWEKQRGWIPVDKKKPENTDPVLTYDNFGEILVGRYVRYTDFEDWQFTLSRKGRTVLYWMPLPEPPERTEVRP